MEDLFKFRTGISEHVACDLIRMIKNMPVADSSSKEEYLNMIEKIFIRIFRIYDNWNTNIELEKDDLKFLYKIDEQIPKSLYNNLGVGVSRMINTIRAGRDVKKDLSVALECSEQNISLTREEALKGNILYHYGDLDLDDLKGAEGLILPNEILCGDLSLENLRNAQNLKLPERIDGSLIMNSLENARGIEFPRIVEGSLFLHDLKSVDGLKLPEKVGWNLYLEGLRNVEGLVLPKELGGIYFMWLESAKGLNLPKIMKGDLNLGMLRSSDDLILPKEVGGSLWLSDLVTAEGLELPKKIGGGLVLNRLVSTKGIKFPEEIGGNLNLEWLQSAEDLVLPDDFDIDGRLYCDSEAVREEIMSMIGNNQSKRM